MNALFIFLRFTFLEDNENFTDIALSPLKISFSTKKKKVKYLLVSEIICINSLFFKYFFFLLSSNPFNFFLSLGEMKITK